MRAWSWWMGLILGALLVAAGIAETIRLTRNDDGGVLFWFGGLVGGGVLVLIGTVLIPRKPVPGLVILIIGCLGGILPTSWTLIAPLLLIALIILNAKYVADLLEASPSE